ncbi:hypothetical protein M8494_00800 [Serratia ureilytica]
MTEASMALPGVAWFFSVITDMNLYLCGELGGPIVPRGGTPPDKNGGLSQTRRIWAIKMLCFAAFQPAC